MQDRHVIADWRLAIARSLFDDKYYLQNNPDVRAAGVDGFEHFVSSGAREGRNPSASINMREYLELHPELSAAPDSPIFHYVSHGLVSAWRTCKLLPEAARALNASPPSSSGAPKILAPEDELSLEALIALIAKEAGAQSRGLILALSHTHYLKGTGGTENVVAAEADAFVQSGWCYVHVCPMVPGANLLAQGDILGGLLVLSINGKRVGTTSAASLAHAIQAPQTLNGRSAQLVIHHLLGFELQSVLVLARACARAPAIVWIHDFYTLCVDPFLMRNDVQFCRAPELDSTACLVCAKGRVRARHLEAMRRLFTELRPRVFAPSAPMLETWKERARFKYRDSTVVPLARLTLGKKVAMAPTRARQLRVAYLGAPVPFKGWQTFERLIGLLRDDDRYAFYRFGGGTTALAGLTEVDVKVTAKDPDAMVRTVAEHEIDVVVNWSACFESFSYITCEAIAAGAFVLAREGAGNVPYLLNSVDEIRGKALRTEFELFAMFISGKAMEFSGQRLSRGHVERTPGAAAKLIAEADA